MYDGIRKISVEIKATEKWKNKGKCITRKATKEEIEKYGIGPGGKDMPRPKGSKNKPKTEVKKSEISKETQETIKVVTEARREDYHTEEVIDKMFKDSGYKGLIEEKETPEHIKEFKGLVRAEHILACRECLKYEIERELGVTNNEPLKEKVKRIMDYCQEVLNQIETEI